MIEAVRQSLGNLPDEGSFSMIRVIGEGSFGKVYLGLWQGTEVAIKTIVLPANMSGSEKREKMGVMEAAISSSLSHPNIVQTFTYTIKPMRDNASSAASGSLHVDELSSIRSDIRQNTNTITAVTSGIMLG